MTTTGREQLLVCAPDAVTAIDAVAGIAAPDLTDPRVAAFAEQFAIDVARIDDDTRAAFLAATGAAAFETVQRIWAADMMPRLTAVLDSLFGEGNWPNDVSESDTWPLLEELMVAIARLRALDPALTELVRLRGARQHDCRLCASRRSQDAIDAGTGAAEFDAVDRYEASDLPERTKAALALTDAVIWTPRHIDSALVDRVHAALTAPEIVEVVLDVVRNALNKIAVALRADAPAVTDGIELFTTDPDGTLVVIGTSGT
jgi:alkylhydroperoxidase family enzyme